MQGIGVRVGAAALAIIGLAASGALAQEDDVLEMMIVVAKNDAASKKAARQQGAEQALGAMTDVDFLVPAAKKAEALEKLGALFEGERVRERGGKHRWSASLSRSKARDVVLDLAAPEETYAKEPVGVVVEAGPASGWGAAELEVARATVSDTLRTYRFKLATDAATAPAVFTLKGGAEAAPHPADPRTLLVRPVAITARFYHRATDALLAEFELRPGRGVPADHVRPGEVNPRHCSPAAEKQNREALARDAARSAVMSMLKRVAGSASAGDAKPAGGAPAAPLKLRTPGPQDRYELRLKGMTAEEATRVVAALQPREGFGDWQERGKAGDTQVHAFTFVGELLVGHMNAVLKETGVEARVEKAGNVVTLSRK